MQGYSGGGEIQFPLASRIWLRSEANFSRNVLQGTRRYFLRPRTTFTLQNPPVSRNSVTQLGVQVRLRKPSPPLTQSWTSVIIMCKVNLRTGQSDAIRQAEGAHGQKLFLSTPWQHEGFVHKPKPVDVQYEKRHVHLLYSQISVIRRFL